jgi:hypothetical protein
MKNWLAKGFLSHAICLYVYSYTLLFEEVMFVGSKQRQRKYIENGSEELQSFTIAFNSICC